MRQQPTPAPPEQLWTVTDVCYFLQINETTCYRMVHEGKLRAMRLRNRLRFDPADVRAAVEVGRGATAPSGQAARLHASGAPRPATLTEED